MIPSTSEVLYTTPYEILSVAAGLPEKQPCDPLGRNDRVTAVCEEYAIARGLLHSTERFAKSGSHVFVQADLPQLLDGMFTRASPVPTGHRVTGLAAARSISASLARGTTDWGVDDRQVFPACPMVLSETTHRWLDVTEKLESCVRKLGGYGYSDDLLGKSYGVWNSLFVHFPKRSRDFPEIVIACQDVAAMAACARMRAMIWLTLDLHHRGEYARELRTNVRRVLKWGGRTLSHYGTPGYDVLKGVEAIAKARMSEVLGGDLLGGGVEPMLEKYQVKEEKVARKAGVPNLHASEALVSLVRATNDPEIIYEVFGMMKVWGSPQVDPVLAAAAQLEGLAVERADDDTSYMMARAAMVISITSRYVDEHGQWPPFEVPPPVGTVFGRLHRERAATFDPTTVPLRDGWFVSFDKFMEIKLRNTFIDYLDDKSVALPFDELVEEIQSERPSREGRSLVAWTMMRYKDVTPAEIAQTAREKAFSPDQHVIAITCKGGEMKPTARAFSMDTPLVRCALNIVEDNVAAVMDLYVPETTMVEGRVATEERFQKLTRVRLSRDTIFGDFDLGEWNKRMKTANTQFVSDVLGDIYGDHAIFEFPHYHFRSSTVHLRHKNAPLKVGKDGRLSGKPGTSWGARGEDPTPHDAGHEGKFQKGWTLFTIYHARAATWETGLDIRWAVQGDNLTATIMPAPSDPRSDDVISALVLQLLNKQFNSCGHDLKPEECSFSTAGMTYSKVAWYRGITYTAELKALMKASPYGADKPDTVGTALEAIASSCALAASQSRDPASCYAVYLAVAGIEVARRLEPGRGSKRMDPVTRVAVLLTWPSSLGGFAVMMPWTTLLRGGTDRLSHDVAILARLGKEARVWAGLLEVLEGDVMWIDSPNVAKLVDDPESVPLLVGTHGQGEYNEQVTNVVAYTCRSAPLRDLLTLDQAPFKEALTAMTPLYPALARAIIDASPFGSARSLGSKITKSTTIRRLAEESFDVYSILTALRSDSMARIRFVDRLLEESFEVTSSRAIAKPPFTLVTEYRRRWKAPSGTLSGLTVVSPFAGSFRTDGGEPAIGVSCRIPLADAFKHRGEEAAYLGKKTREIRTGDEWKPVDFTYGWAQLKRLVGLIGHISSSPGGREVGDKLVKMIHPGGLQAIEPYVPRVVGGTVSHRVDDVFRAPYHLSGNPTTASNYVLSANLAEKLEDDYPLAVQEFYLAASAMATSLAARGVSRAAGVYLTYSLTAVPTVPKDNPVLDLGDLAGSIPTLEANPLLILPEISFTEVRSPKPSQFPASGDTLPSGYRVLVSLYLHCFLATNSMTKAVGGDHRAEMSERGVGGGREELGKFSMDEHIEALAEAVTAAATHAYCFSCLGTVRKVGSLKRVMRKVAAQASPMLTGVMGYDTDGVAADAAELGLVIGIGANAGRRRARRLDDLLSRAVMNRVTRGKLAPGKVVVFSDTQLSDKMIELIVACTCAQASPRPVNQSLGRQIARAIVEVSEAGGESRSGNLVALLRQPGYPGAPEMVLQGIARLWETSPPVSYLKETKAEVIRGLRILPPRKLQRGSAPLEVIGGTVPWCIPPDAPSIENLEGIITPATFRDKMRWAGTHRREGGCWSALTTTFAAIARSVPLGHSVLLVGSGGGAFAAAAVLAGATEVHCADIPQNLPAVEQQITTAPPPECAYILGTAARKVRPSPAMLTGYDYMSHDVMMPWFPHLPRCSTLIIDVQMYPNRTPLPAIVRCIEVVGRPALVRLLLHQWEVPHVAAALGGRKKVRVACISSSSMMDVVFAVNFESVESTGRMVPTVTPVVWADPDEFKRRLATSIAETPPFQALLTGVYTAESLLQFAVDTEEAINALTITTTGREIGVRAERRMRRDAFTAATASVLAEYTTRAIPALVSLRPGDKFFAGNYCGDVPASEPGDAYHILSIAARIAGGASPPVRASGPS